MHCLDQALPIKGLGARHLLLERVEELLFRVELQQMHVLVDDDVGQSQHRVVRLRQRQRVVRRLADDVLQRLVVDVLVLPFRHHAVEQLLPKLHRHSHSHTPQKKSVLCVTISTA